MKYFVALLLVLLFSLPAFALCESPSKDKVTETFCKMDKDKNSLVNKDEFFSAYPNMAEGAFSALDTNKDGSIAFDEWQGFQKRHGAAMKSASPKACPAKPEGATVTPPMTGK